MADYPGSVTSFSTKATNDIIEAAHINLPQAEIVAIENGLLNGIAHVLKPLSDNTHDFGTSGLAWRDAFFKRNLTHLAFAGIGAPLVSNASKQIIEQALTNGQLLIGSTGAAPVAAALTAGAGITVTNAAGSITVAAPGASIISLLKANDGATTSAAAENVDTVAISGLTAKDSLLILLWSKSVTQATASIRLYNNTDGVDISAATNMNANAFLHGTLRLAPDHVGMTTIDYYNDLFESGGGGGRSAASAAVTTAWTGSWTLALRHGGVTAGGTWNWRWVVYKLAGQ